MSEDGARAEAWLLQDHCAAEGEGDLGAVSERVAGSVAEAEPGAERGRWRDRFARLMRDGRFLPSVPVLANAGRSQHLAACFVLEPEDSLASIYDMLREAALIQQASGGVGVELSRLRPAGSPLRRSGGHSPGVPSFVELLAHSARVNRRSGRRPGAHLAVLGLEHPDAPAFVELARSPELAGTGLAVSVSDGFLAAARRGEGRECTRLDAVCEAIIATGQPSLLFADALERANPLPEQGRLRATNPCGEQPLLPGESCVLGSIPLPAFSRARGGIDWPALGAAIEDAVRFLDDVVEISRFPTPAIERATLRSRKIGLGFTGLADLALIAGLRFDSDSFAQLAESIARFFAARARHASQRLARERGAFPASRDGTMRNATLLAIAPTGTLSLLAGCSGGIEPLLMPVRRFWRGADSALWVDRWLASWLEGRCPDRAPVLEALEKGLPCHELPLRPDDRGLLARGAEIAPQRQIVVQAAVQRHVDGAIAKTVHLSEEAVPEEVRELIQLAHESGCKGVAFYRSGCGCAISTPM